MPSRHKSDFSDCNSDDDIGSIGSNTFRENKRREFADYENEDDEDLFNHHNNDVLQLFNNDHHNIMDDDDLNSAGSSLASYEGGWPGVDRLVRELETCAVYGVIDGCRAGFSNKSSVV